MATTSLWHIEGRLKDLSYVKNITAYYRQRLDAELETLPDFRRASSGRTTHHFVPQPEKTFNRGATDYFVNTRHVDIGAFDSPKFTGEPIGTVLRLGRDFADVDTRNTLNNGDGIAYYDAHGELVGERDQLAVVLHQRAEQVGQLFQGLLGAARVGAQHAEHAVQAVEQEVRADPRRQGQQARLGLGVGAQAVDGERQRVGRGLVARRDQCVALRCHLNSQSKPPVCPPAPGHHVSRRFSRLGLTPSPLARPPSSIMRVMLSILRCK